MLILYFLIIISIVGTKSDDFKMDEEICWTLDNQCGMCTKIAQCNTLYQYHRRGNFHDIARLEKSKTSCNPREERMYCCAFNELKKMPIHFLHPHQSAKPSIDEDLSSNNVQIGEHPWMVLIDGKDEYNTYENLLSGALLNQLFVITTASGFVNTFIKANLKLIAKFGIWNSKVTNNVQKISVEDRYFYKDSIYTNEYFKKYYDDDIALLKLERKVEFTSNILPISLIPQHKKNENLIMLKWKKDKFEDTALTKYKTEILTLDKCKHAYVTDDARQLCFEDFTNRENYLGGQIIKNVLYDGKETYKLIGLNSFYTDDNTNIITYLDAYKDWILKTTCVI